MRKWTAAMILLSLLTVQTLTHAQNNSELTTLADRVVNYIQSQKTDWKYKNVEPIKGSANVIIQQWTLDSRLVRIAIMSHRSMSDAAAAMSKLAQDGQVNERLQGLGDEGITWGRGVVSFRRRNIRIDVSAANNTPTPDPKEALKNTEDELKLAKEFTQLVADAIKESNDVNLRSATHSDLRATSGSTLVARRAGM